MHEKREPSNSYVLCRHGSRPRDKLQHDVVLFLATNGRVTVQTNEQTAESNVCLPSGFYRVGFYMFQYNALIAAFDGLDSLPHSTGYHAFVSHLVP